MYENSLRPSEIIAQQRQVIAELQGIVETLKAALAAAGCKSLALHQPWMKGLSPQERALVGALYEHFPNPVSKYDLLDVMPGHDHVADRQVQLVSVKIHHLRKKLGADAIENVWGEGYRLGKAFHDEVRPPASAAKRYRQLTTVKQRFAA